MINLKSQTCMMNDDSIDVHYRITVFEKTPKFLKYCKRENAYSSSVVPSNGAFGPLKKIVSPVALTFCYATGMKH